MVPAPEKTCPVDAPREKCVRYFLFGVIMSNVAQRKGGTKVAAQKDRDQGFAVRGVIEGFFGPPWTHAARLRMIAFMAEAGYNVYAYAPKDDPYHRERWREPYPPDAFKRLNQLIRQCLDRGVDFCWAVSPGLSVSYASQKTFGILVDKLLSVAGKGVNTFALLLDDIPEDLKHAADRKKYTNLGHAHADYANRLHARLAQKMPGCRVWYCPTTYIGTKPNAYLEAVGANLDPAVEVFWTGPVVVSPSITAADARAFGDIIRRKPLLWDNYPVNDYNRNILNLGPLRNRDPELSNLLAGYLSNPMNEDECSKIALLTIADYLRDPSGYDPDKSWRRALQIMGGGAAGASALKRTAVYCSNRVFPNEPAPNTPAEVEKARAGKPSALLNSLKKVETIHADLRAAIDNPHLLRELKPYSRKIERTAAAVRLIVDAKNASSPAGRDALLRRAAPVLRALKSDSKKISNNAIQNYLFDSEQEMKPEM
jgi:hypothetical protein